jgi:hypothetical protein
LVSGVLANLSLDGWGGGKPPPHLYLLLIEGLEMKLTQERIDEIVAELQAQLAAGKMVSNSTEDPRCKCVFGHLFGILNNSYYSFPCVRVVEHTLYYMFPFAYQSYERDSICSIILSNERYEFQVAINKVKVLLECIMAEQQELDRSVAHGEG